MTKEELKEIRRNKGLNQTDMAKELGIGRAQLNRYERGKKPINETVQKLAETMR